MYSNPSDMEYWGDHVYSASVPPAAAYPRAYMPYEMSHPMPPAAVPYGDMAAPPGSEMPDRHFPMMVPQSGGYMQAGYPESWPPADSQQMHYAWLQQQAMQQHAMQAGAYNTSVAPVQQEMYPYDAVAPVYVTTSMMGSVPVMHTQHTLSMPGMRTLPSSASVAPSIPVQTTVGDVSEPGRNYVMTAMLTPQGIVPVIMAANGAYMPADTPGLAEMSSGADATTTYAPTTAEAPATVESTAVAEVPSTTEEVLQAVIDAPPRKDSSGKHSNRGKDKKETPKPAISSPVAASAKEKEDTTPQRKNSGADQHAKKHAADKAAASSREATTPLTTTSTAAHTPASSGSNPRKNDKKRDESSTIKSNSSPTTTPKGTSSKPAAESTPSKPMETPGKHAETATAPKDVSAKKASAETSTKPATPTEFAPKQRPDTAAKAPQGKVQVTISSSDGVGKRHVAVVPESSAVATENKSGQRKDGKATAGAAPKAEPVTPPVSAKHSDKGVAAAPSKSEEKKPVNNSKSPATTARSKHSVEAPPSTVSPPKPSTPDTSIKVVVSSSKNEFTVTNVSAASEISKSAKQTPSSSPGGKAPSAPPSAPSAPSSSSSSSHHVGVVYEIMGSASSRPGVIEEGHRSPPKTHTETHVKPARPATAKKGKTEAVPAPTIGYEITTNAAAGGGIASEPRQAVHVQRNRQFQTALGAVQGQSTASRADKTGDKGAKDGLKATGAGKPPVKPSYVVYGSDAAVSYDDTIASFTTPVAPAATATTAARNTSSTASTTVAPAATATAAAASEGVAKSNKVSIQRTTSIESSGKFSTTSTGTRVLKL